MYFYRDTIGFGGTFIIGRLAIRWGSHRLTLSQGKRVQWYGINGPDRFFL